MVPFWGKQLFVRVALLLVLSTALLAAIWTISQSPGQAGNGLPQGQVIAAHAQTGEPSVPEPRQTSQTARASAATEANAPKPPAPSAAVPDLPREQAPANPVVDVPEDKPRQPEPPPARVEADMPAKPEPNGKEMPKGKEVRGTVQLLDVQKRKLTLRVGEKRDAAYRLAEDVRLSAGANDMPLRDIKPGMRVRAVVHGETIVELRVDGGRAREDDRGPAKKPGERRDD
jgi:hypothetical protein